MHTKLAMQYNTPSDLERLSKYSVLSATLAFIITIGNPATMQADWSHIAKETW